MYRTLFCCCCCGCGCGCCCGGGRGGGGDCVLVKKNIVTVQTPADQSSDARQQHHSLWSYQYLHTIHIVVNQQLQNGWLEHLWKGSTWNRSWISLGMELQLRVQGYLGATIGDADEFEFVPVNASKTAWCCKLLWFFLGGNTAKS